jgi:nucleotide-binding universal stress UspA family protein
MIQKILLPLDGSELAEAALPAAKWMLTEHDISLVLLHVIEKHAPQTIHGDEHLVDANTAERYLQRVVTSQFPNLKNVEIHVHEDPESDLPHSIVEHAQEYHPDLIIITRHGQSGLRDHLVGNIAQQVIAQGTIPTLLLSSNHKKHVFPANQKLLLALDGNPEHDAMISFIIQFSKSFSLHAMLLTIVPTLATLSAADQQTGRLLPGAMQALLDISEESASKYLEKVILRFEEHKVPTCGEIARGDPAKQITSQVSKQTYGFLALASHGKAGFDAFWAGSVASKVISKTEIPLLVVPVAKEKDAQTSMRLLLI